MPEERDVRELSPRGTDKIISIIEGLPNDSQQLNPGILKSVDALVEKQIISKTKDPYQEDVGNLKILLTNLFVLNANLSVALQRQSSDSKQLIASLTKEIKQIQVLVEMIRKTEIEGQRGLLSNLSNAKKMLESISDIATVNDPGQLLRLTTNLLPDICSLLIDVCRADKGEVELILFDIHKNMINLSRKNCVSGDGTPQLKKMFLKLKELSLALPDEQEFRKIKETLSRIEFSEDFNIVALFGLVTEQLVQLGSLRAAKGDKVKAEKTKSSEVFSQFFNQLGQIQKHIFANQVSCAAINTIMNFYNQENVRLWETTQKYEATKRLCVGLLNSKLDVFLEHVKLLQSNITEVQAYKTFLIERSKRKEVSPLRAINAFIGHEYDRANLNVVIKYLDILLKKKPSSREVKAGMLATLLIVGEAFKDLSPALKKKGILKNWYSFYAMRNAIHSILGNEGRRKFEYLLSTSDEITAQLFKECFEDLSELRNNLIIIRDAIPAGADLVEVVKTTVGEEVAQPRKESIDVVLPLGLSILHRYLTESNLVIDLTQGKQLLVVQAKEVKSSLIASGAEEEPSETFFDSHLGGLIGSMQAEANSLGEYCANFARDPETFSLACEFSVAYCGDIVRKLLDNQDYCDHLNDHFLNMHYVMKTERGDLMHDRVLKAEKFDEETSRYFWVVDNLSPCALLALCTIKLSIIGEDFTNQVESDFVGLNQTFNRNITSHFNRAKTFLTNVLGEENLENLLTDSEELDSTLIMTVLMRLKEEDKLELLDSINFLLSQHSKDMRLQFEKLKGKWILETNSRFEVFGLVSDKITSIQLSANKGGAVALERYATEIMQNEVLTARELITEQKGVLNDIIERHQRDTLERNTDKFSYFPSTLLEALLVMVKKTTKLEKDEPKEDLSSVKEKGSDHNPNSGL